MLAPAEVLQQLREQIAQRERQPAVITELAVWPDNWHAAQLFVAMNTQWRVTELASGRRRYDGLRYEALGQVLAELAYIEHAQPHFILMRQLRYLEQRAMLFVNQ